MQLYAITNRHRMVGAALLASGDWPAIAAAFGASIARALDAAPDAIVQVREKDLDAKPLLALVRAAMANAPRVIVNDRADVAAVTGAYGVHLPERGLSVAEARAIVGPRAVVGVSRHVRAGDPAGVDAPAVDADYTQLGPIFETPGKGPPLGPGAWLAGRVAVGGIDSVERALACRAVGATGIAVIRAAWDDGSTLAALARTAG